MDPSGVTWAIWEGDTAALWAYDPDSDRWLDHTTEGQLPYGVGTDAFLTAGDDGRLYLFAWGDEGTDVFAYDPTVGAWESTPLFLEDQTVLDAARGEDGRLYFVGRDPESGRSRMFALSPGEAELAAVGPAGNYGSIVEALADGRIYAVAPDDGAVHSFDPEAERWRSEPAPSGGEMLGHRDVAALGDRLVVDLGASDAPRLVASDFAEERWVDVPPPPGDTPVGLASGQGRLQALEDDSRSGRSLREERGLYVFVPDS